MNKNTKTKDRIIKKLEILIKYKKLKKALLKENDKVAEFKKKEIDKEEIEKIKQKLK